MKKLRNIVLFILVTMQGTAWAQLDTVSVDNKTVRDTNQMLRNIRQVGAVDVISGNDLQRSTEYKVNSSLAGLASGLYVSKYSGGPGSGWTNLKVRGLSRGNIDDAPLIVVDGIPNRSLSDLTVESIESITVLKDINTKMLYGSQAANGVLSVTTKRGKFAKRKLSFSVETGVRKATVSPNYLNAFDYATKYNEARSNDGVAPLYSEEALNHYKNGTSPLLYPNMDYYGTFLKNNANVHRISSMLTGGGEKTQYFLNLEYVNENGLEKVGDTHSFNQINLVSNLDYKVNDIISMNLDISSRLGMHARPRIDQNPVFQGLSTHRPNDYPFFVTQNQSVNTDSLAFNTKGGKNLYGELTRSGYLKNQDFKSQTSIGISFNLNDYVEGLTANISLGFDSYNNIYYGKTLNYATYRIVNTDSLVRVGEDEVKSYESTFYDDFYRNVATKGSLNYDRTFGKHAFTGNLIYQMRSLAYKSVEDAGKVKQDQKGIHGGLKLNYAYNNRYVLELNGTYLGSDKFERGKRYKPFGSAGAAWIVSNEKFLEGSNVINFLKLKGSYGVMGYDNSFDYYIHRDAFSGSGAYYFGVNNDGNIDYGMRVSKIGNENVTFEESEELNVGMEAKFLKNKLTFEINYFDNLRSGMPTYLRSTLPGYVAGVAPIGNYNQISNSGVDMAIQYTNKFGDLYLSFGGNFMSSKSVYLAYDELNFYSHLNRTGKSTDVLFGYIANGLYTSEQDIINYGVSSSLGELMPGDIKYENITNDLDDNVIDEFDLSEIGHFFPRINYGMNLNLEYKGFELYLLGQGVADVDKIKNNSYFFNYGERKYSNEVMADGYPRLTTATTGGHSFQNSTYWLEDGSYFKLRMAEFSYTLPNAVAQGINANKIKVFVKGTDLFTLSKFKALDPEDMNAGITKYPLYTTGSFGAKIIF